MRANHSVIPKRKKAACPNPKDETAFGAGFHTLHYMEWGEVTEKGTVVCVHGLLRNARDFDFLACELVKEGYHVICPDVVGRGDSEWLHEPAYYTYPTYVADVFALMTQLGLCNVHWVGTSMGGLIGMMLESGTPLVIDKLVLNDIGAFIPKAALDHIGSYIGRGMEFATLEEAKNHLKKTYVGFGIREEYQWNHMARNSFKENESGKWIVKYDPALALAFMNARGKPRKMSDLDMWQMWNLIKAPTLLLRGKESSLLLAETAQRMAQRKGVKLVEISGAGHAPSLMSDDQIDIVINWLNAA